MFEAPAFVASGLVELSKKVMELQSVVYQPHYGTKFENDVFAMTPYEESLCDEDECENEDCEEGEHPNFVFKGSKNHDPLKV